MKIKNIIGTSFTTCVCGSWLDHWKKFSKQSVPSFCPINKCHEKVLVGAHVRKYASSDEKWYIYPLCSTHNQSEEILEVSDTYKLVIANKKETCEP